MLMDRYQVVSFKVTENVFLYHSLRYLAALTCQADRPIVVRFSLATFLEYRSDYSLFPFMGYFQYFPANS